MVFQRKSTVRIVILVAVMAGIGAFGFFPLIRGIMQDAKTIQEKKLEQLQQEMGRQEIQRYQAFAAQNKDKIQQFQKILVDKNLPIDFVEFLEETAQSANLSIEWTPRGTQQDASQKEWASLGYGVEGEGPYLSCLQFIRMLENAPYLITLKDIAIEQRRESQTINCTLLFSVFAQ